MVHSTYNGFLCTGATLSLFQLGPTELITLDTLPMVLYSTRKVLELRESLTFVTLPETTVTSNKSYSYLHWVTIDNEYYKLKLIVRL